MSDHIGHTLDELIVLSNIRASLIPDESLDAISLDRMKHSIISHVWSVVMNQRFYMLSAEVLVRIRLENLLRSPCLDTCTAIGT